MKGFGITFFDMKLPGMSCELFVSDVIAHYMKWNRSGFVLEPVFEPGTFESTTASRLTFCV
jgi:hypothetical protein